MIPQALRPLDYHHGIRFVQDVFKAHGEGGVTMDPPEVYMINLEFIRAVEVNQCKARAVYIVLVVAKGTDNALCKKRLARPETAKQKDNITRHQLAPQPATGLERVVW